MARRGLLVALAIVSFGAGARAQSAPAAPKLVQRSETIEREVPAGYGTVVTVTAGPHGGVQVSAWRERKVRVEARIELNAPTEADLALLAKVIGVSVEPNPTSIKVTTKGPHDKKWMKGVKDFPKQLLTMPWRIDYVVWVPEYTSLSVEVSDGETLVEGISGIISVANTHGDIRLTNISGATQVTASAGSLTIATRDRSWRGGNFNGAASGDIVFTAPDRFSGLFDLAAPGGVTMILPDERKSLGPEFKDNVGAGGSSVTLVSGGKIEVSFGSPP